jgi:DNA-binding NtrC family response regulator
LSVLPIIVPPLRDRRDDIPLLAYKFAARAAAEAGKPFQGFASDALALLREHSWPGNVRELQHAVERGVILSGEPTLQAYLFAGLQTELRPGVEYAPGRRALRDAGNDDAAHTLVVPTLDLMDIETQVIDYALTVSGGNRTRAAALLGIDVRTLRRKLNGTGGGRTGPRAAGGEGGDDEARSETESVTPKVPAPSYSPVPARPDKLPQGK